MFWSQLSDHPQGSSFVLMLLLLFQPACFIYLVCGCMLSAYVMSGHELSVHDQTSHRQTTYSHIPDRRSKQAEKVVIALAQRTTPEDGQIIMTETCRVF
jgi:hypothetical protein